MVLYRIYLLTFDDATKEEEPGFFHPWYTDDAAMLGPA